MKRNKKDKKLNNNGINKKRLIVYPLLLVLVPLVLYFRVINFNFSNFDDTNLITDNYNIIGNIENVTKAFTVDAFFGHKTSFYRPLQTVSFIIDAQISGQNPWAYHLTNLILFILIVIALFILLNKLGIKREIALLLSLLYSVHPMMTSAVCWVPARGDLFLTLFGLMSFISFINYFINKKPRYLVIHFFCFLLSCLAKETALIFPLLLTIYFYYILKKESSWKKMLPFLILWCSSFLIYFLLRKIAITANKPPSVLGIVPFLKNLPTIPITFGKIFLPLDLTTMPLFNNLSAVIGILIIIVCIVVIVKYRIYKNPYIILGTLWFLGFTLPPLYFRLTRAEFSEEYLEHRALLPMIGIFIIFGMLLSTLFSKWSSRGMMKIFIPIFIFFAYLAYSHSSDYSEPMAFVSSAIASNSQNAAALNSRGVEYALSSNTVQQSIADFENAIKICPIYSSPYYNIAGVYDAYGDEVKAEYYYSQALKYDTLYLNSNNITDNSYINLSNVKIKLNKFDEDIVLLKRALKEFPTKSDLYNNLGYIYYLTAKYDSALYAFSKAIEFKPNSASLYTNRGLTKYSLKDFKGALSDYTKVLTIDSSAAGSWYNSGKAKIELKDYQSAISDLSTAIKINPKWGDAYFQRGVAYSKLNLQSAAKEDLVEAKKLGSKETEDGK